MFEISSVYYIIDDDEEEEQNIEDELGGLFRVLKSKSEKNKADRATINKTDCSKFEVTSKHDWDLEEVCCSVNFIFKAFYDSNSWSVKNLKYHEISITTTHTETQSRS